MLNGAGGIEIRRIKLKRTIAEIMRQLDGDGLSTAAFLHGNKMPDAGRHMLFALWRCIDEGIVGPDTDGGVTCVKREHIVAVLHFRGQRVA